MKPPVPVTATIHDLYVWKLSKELQKDYEDVSTNVVLQDRKRVLGEIDILAEKDGEIHVFEVKCSFRVAKAKQQFRKIRKHYTRSIDAFFLYCGSTDRIVEIRL